MEAFFAALEATAPAEYLRASRWGYAAVNGAHILGIALLVGAILPLNLRLLGFWPSIPRANLLRVLVPISAMGLALAVLTGSLLSCVTVPRSTMAAGSTRAPMTASGSPMGNSTAIPASSRLRVPTSRM